MSELDDAKIFEAVKEGKVEEVEKLIFEGGTSVNIKDARGWTPLHWAAWAGHVEIAKLLLENGADVDA
ncbi:MAG: ankyrin repeat domain-containing protein, partial [Pyrobaculum sp.]